MTRVPTTATYRLYMSQITKQKSALSDVSYQATTGNRYSSYDKYGLSTYRLLSLQNERAVTTKYLETNSITKVVLESQQKAVDGIRASLTNVRSQVRDFYSRDLTAMSKNASEEELLALQNVQEAAFESMSLIAYYLNSQVDGNYIFGGGDTTKAPVNFPYKSLQEFQAVYDGNILKYPTSYSASLSKMSTSADVLGGVTIKQEFQTVTPKTTEYTGAADNEMTFNAANKTLTATKDDTFAGVKVGEKVVIAGTAGNNGTLTVAGVSDDGKTLTFAETITDETLTDSSALSLTKGEWVFASEKDRTTGVTTNSLTARAGTFSDLKVGEKMLVNGTNANNGYLTVKSVSLDGSFVTFEENVQNETLNITDLLGGNLNIQQSTQTGTITASKNTGTVLETFDITQPLTTDAANNTISGTTGAFSGIKGGQTITVTDAGGTEHSLYVKSVSDDGSLMEISTSTPVPNDLTNAPLTIKTHSDIAGFVTSSMKGNALQTGDIGFSVNQNTMTATVKGAFSSYKSGDCLIIKGADGNDRTYVVDSVSKDGRTVKFSDDTPVQEEMSLLNNNVISDGAGVTICKTYSVGATVEMGGTNGAYNGKYTVLGVSDDGGELIVGTKDFPEYGATETFASARFETATYYDGGQLAASYRISETTSVSNDVNASSPAFEKVFRALGAIAQGNMLDSDDVESARRRVSEALDLLDEALTANSNEKNGDVTSIQYAVISKLDTVKTTLNNQTDLNNSLDTYIQSLTQVDKTEAATLLLQQANNLKMSYSVLSTINGLTLLDYM